MTFIEDQKWKELDPVSAWKYPDSIQMGIVSHFFKLSHYLKEVNNVMLHDYGLPPWVTYVLFAIATILLGALLGLVLVSIIDLIFPPVPQNSRKSFSQVQANASSADQDVRDEIEDDGETNDNDEEEATSTSEGEKYSGSDSEQSENEENDKDGRIHKEQLRGKSLFNLQGNFSEVFKQYFYFFSFTDNKKQTTPKSSPEVRKRKPRKAD